MPIQFLNPRSCGVALVAFWLGASAHAATPTPDSIDRLIHESGLWNQVAEIAPAFAQGVDDAAARSGGPDARQAEALRQAFATAYSADRLRPAVARELSTSLSGDDIDASLVWLSGSVGRRLTALEEKASTADALRERMESGPAFVRELSPERLAQYTRLVSAIHAGEVGATMMINLAVGLARGFGAASPGLSAGDGEAVRTLMEARRPDLVAAMDKQQLLFFATSYASVSDADIALYVDFAESPLGRRYQAATVMALDKAMTEAAVEAGRLLVNQKSA